MCVYIIHNTISTNGFPLRCEQSVQYFTQFEIKFTIRYKFEIKFTYQIQVEIKFTIRHKF